MGISQQFEPNLELINFLSRSICDEIIRSAGVTNHRIRRWFVSLALKPPAHRFAEVAARFDFMVKYRDFQEAAQDLLSKFVDWIDVKGLEFVPHQGPLLIVANHPGTYDGLSIISSLPRDDLKVVIAGVPFTQELESAGKHFIYAPPVDQTHGRMHTLRSSAHHLQEGGSLLLFPSGRIDPDPALFPGANLALNNWSRSLELLLRRVPDTQITLAIISGVLSPSSLRHPLTRLLRNIETYRTAQLVQVVGQLFSPKKNRPIPQLSYGAPFLIRQLLVGRNESESSGDPHEILQAIIEHARLRLYEHLQTFGIAPLDNWEQFITQ